ncbi:Carboxypeptidase [Balamuthia mandrillaris]
MAVTEPSLARLVVVLALCVAFALASRLSLNDEVSPKNGLLFAQEMGRVLDVKQYYGYIGVNKEQDSQLFYWMFEAQKDPQSAPLLLWLAGGPGCASELALFLENGPFHITPLLELQPNPYSWNKVANLLYVDQPAGTGFSIAKSTYVKNSTVAAEDMYSFLQSFFAKYPRFRDSDFFIAGESYAGHYIPALTARIIEGNSRPSGSRINLRGVAIGDGTLDGVSMPQSWGPFAHQHGLIEEDILRKAQRQYQVECKPLVEQRNYSAAYPACYSVLDIVMEGAGRINPYDIRQPKCKFPPLCYNLTPLTQYLNKPEVKSKLGVKGKWTVCNENVHVPFEEKDIEFSFVNILGKALPLHRVMFYNGFYDLMVNTMGTSSILREMQWEGQAGFAAAANTTWKVDGEAAGTVRAYHNLTYVVVNDAGHLVPHDQPNRALDLITRFLTNTPFTA